MNFNIGEFEPFPVSHPSRPETPPLDFDILHPFTGVELTVSGLPRDSLVAAQNHLQHILQDLGRQYTNFPSVDIVSPATTDPLKEVPRPDILDRVRVILDGVDGLCARWKVSASRMDTLVALYFQAQEGANLATLKTKFDRILMTRRLQVQTSWVPKDGRRIFYLFLAHDTFNHLTNQPLEVDRRFYHPAALATFNPRWGWK